MGCSFGKALCTQGEIFAVFLPADKKLRDPAAGCNGHEREGDAEKQQERPLGKDFVADGHNGDAWRQEEECQVVQEKARDARDLLWLDDFCTK